MSDHTEPYTLKTSAFVAGVQACLDGNPREVPCNEKCCHTATTSWLRGYDAARPYRVILAAEGADHA